MIICLLTDFGMRDYFVAAMKGRILKECENAQIVDITHEIAPQNIHQAMFTLSACRRDFPEGTCFVSVVDPGVGSGRKIILVEKEDQLFVAPDNGLLSFLFWNNIKPMVKALNVATFVQKNAVQTFHGRDIFAPFAGKLAAGADISNFLEPFDNPVEFDEPVCNRKADRTIAANIIHIDIFGNLVTSIKNELYANLQSISVGTIFTKVKSRCFSSSNDDELLFYPGSAGYIEIAVKNGSAAEKLSVLTGVAITANTGV